MVETQKPSGRMRVRLSDVAVWVLGAALLAFVGRRFWESWRAWRAGGGIPGFFDMASQCPMIGLSVSALAVGVGLRLGMQAVRALRGSFVPIPGRRGVAVVWRLVAVGLLVGVVGVEILAVRPRVSSTMRGDLGLELFPLCGLLLVIGLLAGIKPPSPRRSERAGTAVAAVLLAVCLGVGLAAGHMIIPHLVLVAIEGVFNAHILRVDGRGLASVSGGRRCRESWQWGVAWWWEWGCRGS